MKVIITDSEGKTTELSFEKDLLIVGRKATCDIHLENDYISREHLEIKNVSGVILIKDMTSSNWVSYNGDKLPKREEIKYFDFSPLSLPGGFSLSIEMGRTFEVDNEFIKKDKTITRSNIHKSLNKKKTRPKRVKLRLEKPTGDLKAGRRPEIEVAKNSKKIKILIISLLALFVGAGYFYGFDK